MSEPTSTGKHVCPPEHRHAAASTCYHHHKCRCTPCEDRVRTRQADRRKQQAYGRWTGMVPATIARNHIRVLSAAGIGARRVAALAGVTPSHVADIRSGVTRHISPHLERRIRAIPVDESVFALGQLVPAVGVVRRLQALGRCGWSFAALESELGMQRDNVRRMACAARVTVRTRRAVEELYERLWDVPPPQADKWERRAVTATRRRAEAAGWLPPMAWDDIDTDPEPPAGEEVVVDEIAVALAVEGRRVTLTREERLLAIAQLHAAGHSDSLIAHMLVVSVKTTVRDRNHLGLPANDDPTPLIRKLAA